MGQFIYIHVPFCEARCPYCDFFTQGSGREARELADEWLKLVARELVLWVQAGDLRQDVPVATIYFGGGTPSLVSPDALKKFLTTVRDQVPFAADVEITMEMQPATADERKVAGYAEAGVNRFSIGVQSLTPRLLAFLERRHTVEDSLALIDAARKYGRLSLDLIAALPGQTLADWQAELEQAIASGAEHLSVYELTYYRGTRLREALEQGRTSEPGEEQRLALYEYTIERLTAAGYEQYEISNFARPGCRSRHNENYWKLGDYVGLGAGAHSFVCPHRHLNPPDVERYRAAIRAGRLAREISDPGDDEIFAAENLFMGLRLAEGVDLDAFRARFGVDVRAQFASRLEPLIEGGFMRLAGNRLQLTHAGRLRADAVVGYLVG